MTTTVLLLGLSVVAGAIVQSSVGFGLAVVIAPFAIIFAPDLMPGAVITVSFFLPVIQLLAGPRDIAWRPLLIGLAARLPFTAVGVAVVALLSTRAIALGVAVLILVTVAAAVTVIDVRPTDRNAAVAGAISGISGTAASIGGPFMAIVLRRLPPTRVRATLSAFFLVGAAIGLAGLAIGHQLTTGQVFVGLAWVPFLLVGYAAAAPVRRHLDHARMQRAVLVFCVIAAVSVIVRVVLT